MRAVNLLPVEPKRTRKAPGLVTQLAIAAPFVVGGLLVAGYLLTSSQVNSKRATLTALQDELAAIPKPLEPQQNPALASERSLRIATLSATLQSRLVWDRVLREISEVLPADVWLTTLSAITPEAPATVSAPAPGAATATNSTTTTPSTTTTTGTATTPKPASAPAPAPVAEPLNIQGYTYSQEGVARLLSRLQVVPALQNVKLVSSAQSSLLNQKVVAFTIQASVRPQETG